MKRRLRHLYWTGIAITMVMATVAVAMMVKLKIDDSREALDVYKRQVRSYQRRNFAG